MKPFNKPYYSAAELDRIINLALASPRIRAAAQFAKFLRECDYIGLDSRRSKGLMFVAFRRYSPVPDYIRQYSFIVDTSFDTDGVLIYDVFFNVEDFSKIIRSLFGV